MSPMTYQTAHVDGLKLFYREAGDPTKPTLLLLHGFPTSSHMFRDLIPLLADEFHLVAPDLPGFGQSDRPTENSFDFLGKIITRFTEVIGLQQYALYVFDYGAPTGFRVAMAHPERVTAIISQNGNAYEEGLSEGWHPLQRYWRDPSPANREALREMLSETSIRWQYEHGVKESQRISPDGWALDAYYTARPGIDEIQLDFFGNYASNVALYPQFQAYFRQYQPKLLAIWGEHDPFFIPPGAHAYKRDLPDADVRLLDTGHFALETHAPEIAQAIRDLLKR